MSFPGNLYKAQQHCNIHSDTFRRYVVCRKCHKIYFMNECVEGVGSYERAKTCTFKLFHQQCNSPLLKTVELCSGKKIFYPHLTYCYLGLKTALQSILNRPSLVSSCERLRNVSSPSNVFSDIHDGQVWKDFKTVNGKPFLSEPFTYALLLNMDWYQPYKHLSYSVGAIYISILNLPRDLRYKVDSILLIGITPGPHEPKLNVNSYLQPLVDELRAFWDGVELCVATESVPKLVRCALVCASCDLPAARKVCGFLGHMAAYGCSKCLKRFSGSFGRMDYSGFDRESWIKRTNRQHRQDALALAQSTSKSALQRNESKAGCRYSVLLELPYFDAPRMCVIDPMHNLFLGIAKHYIHHIWIDTGIISSADFETIQDRVNRMIVPTDIGRIPSKIKSSFASFTADQLKNWVIYYSPIALHGILAGDHLQCWQHFVLACRILCSQSITVDQLCIADALILRFCRRTEHLYGKDKITPNMHMSCHLSECVKDYGPLAAFWLFAFERYNGILGKLPNNNRSIEIQSMKRFITDQSILTLPRPHNFKEEFDCLLQVTPDKGSLGNCLGVPMERGRSYLSTQHSIQMPKHYRRCVFSSSDIADLKQLFSKMYYIPEQNIEPNTSYKRYSYSTINGKTIGSYRGCHRNSSFVIAKWVFELYGSCSPQLTADDVHVDRPVKVNFIIEHAVSINDTVHTHVMLSASWFKPHSDVYNYCGKPITVWEYDIFELSGVSSFIPVQLIQSRTVCLVDKPSSSEATLLYVSSYINF